MTSQIVYKASTVVHNLQPVKKPAKIMYIVSDLTVGGTEMMLYNLLAETDRSRFEPLVVSLKQGSALRDRVEVSPSRYTHLAYAQTVLRLSTSGDSYD